MKSSSALWKAIALFVCAASSGAMADEAVTWGYNGSGQLGTGVYGNSTAPVTVAGFSAGVALVANGGAHNLAIWNGALYAWGDNADGELGIGSFINAYTPAAVTIAVQRSHRNRGRRFPQPGCQKRRGLCLG